MGNGIYNGNQPGSEKDKGKDESGDGKREFERSSKNPGAPGASVTGNTESEKRLSPGRSDRPFLVDIELPEPPELKEKKGKEKGRPKKTQTKKTGGLDADEVSALVTGLFAVLAYPFGNHWQLSSLEAENISGPLTRILNRMDLGEQVAKFGDGAMLLLAVGAATVPRVILTLDARKSSKTARPGKETPANVETRPTERASNAAAASDPAGYADNVFKLLSPLEQ